MAEGRVLVSFPLHLSNLSWTSKNSVCLDPALHIETIASLSLPLQKGRDVEEEAEPQISNSELNGYGKETGFGKIGGIEGITNTRMH